MTAISRDKDSIDNVVEQGLGDLPAAPRRAILFGIVAIAIFMGAVDIAIVATALPTIHKSLRATINWASWTITIYNLGQIIALPIAGKFSDQLGRRRVFLWGVAIFTVSSLACGFATNIYMLIGFRIIQALGGGTLTPSAAGLVSDNFGKDRGRAIGMFGTIGSSGILVGPVVGGLIVSYLSWRWIFFVNVPLGIVLICATAKFVPKSRPLPGSKTDVRGLILVATFILSAVIAITNFGDKNTEIYDPAVIIPLLSAIGLLYLFARHWVRTEAPIIPIRLIRTRGLAAVNFVNFLWGGISFGITSLIALYAEDRYHLDPLNAGVFLSTRAAGSIAIGLVAAFVLHRSGYRKPLILGLLLLAVGLLALSVTPRWGLDTYAWLNIGAAIVGLASGVANPATRNAGMQLAVDEVGALVGLRQMLVNLGIIFSVSLTTAVLNRSATPGIAEAHVFLISGAISIVMVPLIFRVPEYVGAW